MRLIAGRTASKLHQAIILGYAVALGLIASLIVLGYVVAGYAVGRYDADAPLINQAGRQRMLSQKIAKDALKISFHPEPGAASAELDELAKDFSSWSEVHEALGRGGAVSAQPSQNSPQAQALYESVDEAFERMARPLRAALGVAGGQPLVELRDELTRAAEASSDYLVRMDALVGRFEQEARRRAGRLRTIQGGLLVAVLGLLAAEALLIFRPLVRRVRGGFEALEAEKEALQVSGERLRLAVEAAEIGTWDWDIQEGSLHWDRRSKAILGFPPDEPVSYELFVGTIHPEDRKRVLEAVDDCLRTGGDYQVEYRTVHGDADVRWVSARGGLRRDPEGRLARMVGVALDVTDRREYEAAQVRAQAAEAAQRATSGFMAVASHELHTPLNAILGYADLLLDEAEGPLTPGQRRSLERLAANGQRLVRLAEGVLDLSRLRAGTLRMERTEIRVRQSLEASLRPYGELARAKGLGFSWSVAADVPDSLWGDPARLSRALGALLDNAVKFTEQGKVTVAVRRDRLDGKRGCLRFEVADTGRGIAPEERDRLFRAFEQAEPAATHSYEGLGLGLALCAALAERMGGRAWAESGSGRGSTFFFTACFDEAG
ncbi:MAG: ATP-binding protein [Deferrisomatales bacterium]|nr:ATP-binding protein [Deferrisomatales bacterium]